ncbi:MAG: penicillin-binding protein 1C [Deltaproteobacteria bacterium]|nr:penicillin-binding protein 1C [Deltaproteobacteria bacterium]
MNTGRPWAAFAAVVIVLGYALIPRPALYRGVRFSQAVYAANGTLLRLTLSSDERYRLRVPLGAISPRLVEATLTYEDQWFRFHPGVNPVSLGRAFWQTYIRGSRRMGGSTITMQLARLRFGVRSNTLGGKLVQILRALQLERHYSKDEILEAYLALAPYGGNVEGVGAASLIYFQKSPDRLTLAESLALSVIPQNPTRHRPGLRPAARLGGEGDTDINPWLEDARRAQLTRWLVGHPEERERKSLEKSGKLPLLAHSRKGLPFLAPHFVDWVLNTFPDENILTTTLEPDLQAALERTGRQYRATHRRVGVDNLSALLVDTRDMGVKAMLGSADYNDPYIQGQVIGPLARRSPGSALKPFIYALALDQGLIHPHTVLKDAPAAFGDYDPENFDGVFKGPVSATEALVNSRNVPAIYLASRLKEPTLYQLLKQAEVKGLREEAHYGLALVLGGGEITMAELTAMYAMLANEGEWRPLRLTTRQPLAAGRRLVSAEAAVLTLGMLRANSGMGGEYRSDWVRNPLPVSWKTGTSHGFKDAWTVGVAGPYVLAVWVGHFDGQGNPAFVGREMAAPLMFSMLDSIRALRPDMAPLPASPGLKLVRVKVCAASGGLPGPHCPVVVPTWFIPGVSPIELDTVYREVWIDRTTGLRSCGQTAHGARREVYEFWPSDMLAIFRKAGIPRRVPPPYMAGCHLSAMGAPPEITSPREGVVYTLPSRQVGVMAVPLSAVMDGDAHITYWFVDNDYLGRSGRGETFFWKAQPGRYVIRALDDQGRHDAREVIVTTIE